jgi:RNA polymerase sigma-70 factor, ECF subfamily
MQNFNCDVPSLWLEHKSQLRSFIQKRIKDENLTNDILQEVLMKVYNFCASKSGVRNIRSWLFQIAQNTITDHYRNNSKLTLTDELPEMHEEEENTAFKEATNYIIPMLGFLPEEYAIPLRMSDIDGLKQADIAEQLGLGLSATKSRIQRGRQLLKAEFLTCCHFETDLQGNIISFDIKPDCKPLQTLKKKISSS